MKPACPAVPASPAGSGIAAEPVRPVRIDDFATYRYVNSVRVAPDARSLVYAVTSVDISKNRYVSDLWTTDVATRCQRRLTSSGEEGRFDFMDDGSVLFVSARAKSPAPAAPAAPAALAAPAPAAPAAPAAPGAPAALAAPAMPVAPAQAAPVAPAQADAVALVAEKPASALADDPVRGTDLYRIALDGGEATPYLHIPLTVADWKQLPDGRLLVRARELFDDASPYASLEDIPFWENGGSYTAGLRWGLYVVEPPELAEPAACALSFSPGTRVPAAPASMRCLTAPNESVAAYALSSDRTQVYLLSNTYCGKMPLTNRVSSIDIASGTATLLGPTDMAFSLLDLLDDATLVLLGTDMRAHGINEDPQVFLMGTDGSDYRRVSHADFDVDFYNHITTDARQGGGQVSLACGGSLYFAHAAGEASHLSRIAADGTTQLLVGGEGSLDCFDTLDGRTLYYVAMRPNLLPELYCRTLGDDGEPAGPEERLTDFSSVLAGAAVIEPESFEFASNGADLRGFVVKPAGYDPNAQPGTYPGILWVHGGPKCVMGDVFFHEIQFLSSLGYFVFYTNPHGSGGHGIEYAASIFGGYGGMDFDDLMTFTNEVLERYPALDSARLAEMGGSYGGFMTNWVIGHTDRFACCVSQRSISNWVSMFGVSDIGYYFADDQTLGWPWGVDDATSRPRVEAMWEQSPLKYADRVTTPTLFLHSDADYRCPLEQGMQMFTALQVHGVPSRLTVFKGENHELSRSGKPQARLRRLAEIANWCARWLKGDEQGEAALRG